jgi:hypothetical protein
MEFDVNDWPQTAASRKLLMRCLKSSSRWKGFHMARLLDGRTIFFELAKIHRWGQVTLVNAIDMRDIPRMFDPERSVVNLKLRVRDIEWVNP